jgi:hypothetical protein
MFLKTESINLYSFGRFGTKQKWSCNTLQETHTSLPLICKTYNRKITKQTAKFTALLQSSYVGVSLYLILNTTLHLNFIIQIHAKCVIWLMKLWTITLTFTHIMTKGKENMVTKPWNMIWEWADSEMYFSFWSLSGFAYTHVRYGHCIPSKKTFVLHK